MESELGLAAMVGGKDGYFEEACGRQQAMGAHHSSYEQEGNMPTGCGLGKAKLIFEVCTCV